MTLFLSTVFYKVYNFLTSYHFCHDAVRYHGPQVNLCFHFLVLCSFGHYILVLMWVQQEKYLPSLLSWLTSAAVCTFRI